MPSERYISGHPIYSRASRVPARQVGEVLRKGLGRRRKDDLVDALVTLAEQSPVFWRAVALKCDLPLDVPAQVAASRRAIYDATPYDEKRINSNFQYDCEAYEFEAISFQKLLKLGQWLTLMELSIELDLCAATNWTSSPEL